MYVDVFLVDQVIIMNYSRNRKTYRRDENKVVKGFSLNFISVLAYKIPVRGIQSPCVRVEVLVVIPNARPINQFFELTTAIMVQF